MKFPSVCVCGAKIHGFGALVVCTPYCITLFPYNIFAGFKKYWRVLSVERLSNEMSCHLLGYLNQNKYPSIPFTTLYTDLQFSIHLPVSDHPLHTETSHHHHASHCHYHSTQHSAAFVFSFSHLHVMPFGLTNTIFPNPNCPVQTTVCIIKSDMTPHCVSSCPSKYIPMHIFGQHVKIWRRV
jgi:hypothetical protein